MGERLSRERIRQVLDQAEGATGIVALEHIDALEEEIRAKDAEIAAFKKALEPFAEFARAFDANPMRGIDDSLYSIHGGADAPSGKGAELRLSDCRAALKLLKG